MPKVTIWIREENEETWKSLVNRSEWVNWHLTEKRTAGEASELPKATIKVEGFKPLKAKDLCPHYQPKGLCLVKGCKYGR